MDELNRFEPYFYSEPSRPPQSSGAEAAKKERTLSLKVSWPDVTGEGSEFSSVPTRNTEKANNEMLLY